MTKRFFYTDPLAAAWMAKHFGIRFYTLNLKTGEKRDIVDTQLLHRANDTFPPEENYYVQLESLPLLEPQIDDAVEFDRWFWERQRDLETRDYPYQAHYGRVVKYGRNDEYRGISSAGIGWDNTTESHKFSLPFKIIQRNGIAFMWPESEKA